jgi:hypothetical protein
MRRGAKPVNIEVTEPVRVEALDLDAQGITRLAPNEEEQALGQSGKVIFINFKGTQSQINSGHFKTSITNLQTF